MADSCHRHGRDNKLKVWLLKRTADDVGASGTAAGIGEHAPELRSALDVNALNFCRFSLVRTETCALVAVPNLVDSSFVSGSLPYEKLALRRR
jgi:hypothetical protein